MIVSICFLLRFFITVTFSRLNRFEQINCTRKEQIWKEWLVRCSA